METANLPPVHATGSGQTEHRKTGLLLRMQHSTLVGCSSRRRRQLFRCCFVTTKQNPRNNKSSTTILQLLCLYLLAPLLGLLRPAAQYQ